MVYSILFISLAALSCWYWKAKYIPAEVAQNAAAIKKNGSQDNLQRGFHSREVWSRVWPGLACCFVPAVVPAVEEWVSWKVFDLGTPPNWWAVLLAFLSMAALLTGVFVRDFTPKLNLAMHLAYKPEWYASPASKSWPDAAAWKVAHLAPMTMTVADRQEYANHLLKQLVLRTYRWCLIFSLAAALAALWVGSRAA